MSSTIEKRVPLFQRLPEIYRIRDSEQTPPDQLKAYLAGFEEAFGAIHENIEALYHDLFIETCDDWVIPYIADLLGASHLKGDPWTIRADVADTIPLRRRKGTRQAIERLAANLTAWPARAVELRDSLGWHQHLNHQRPDAGGAPPLADPDRTRFAIPRGGTVPVRDPAALSLLGTPFDRFSYTIDTKPAIANRVPYNLPNLAIFLWRLAAYRLSVSRPVFANPLPIAPIPAPEPGEAAFAARFNIHPLGRPVRLFNTYRADPRAEPARLTRPDEVPGPIPYARLIQDSEEGNPDAYVDIDTYDPGPPIGGIEIGDSGIQIFLPEGDFTSDEWTLRGDNLCAWENGLRRTIANREIVIDPDIGRILFGLDSEPEVESLRDSLLMGHTYGAVGEIGAHPIDHGPRVESLGGLEPAVRIVNGMENPDGLRDALIDVRSIGGPILIEIADSLVHDLDLADPALEASTSIADGERALLLGNSVVIRAADGHRPIIRLAQPLRFRPTNVFSFTPSEQEQLENLIRGLTVRFEGVQLAASETGSFAPDDALIMRAAIARLEIVDTTLDPGGHRLFDNSRAPLRPALQLADGYGFIPGSDEEDAFRPIPDILLQRSVAGSLLIDPSYQLVVEDSIVDGGSSPASDPASRFAIAAASPSPQTDWGVATIVRRATLLGRTRVEQARGQGGLFVGPLEVLDNQQGCIKYSWFWRDGNRLPPNHACVDGSEAELKFTSTWFADPGYAQLSRSSDFRILHRGPQDDAMGATNFLLHAHRWANLHIRLREFMPIGIRPATLTAT